VTQRLPAPLPWLAGLLALYLLGPLIAGIPQIWLADWATLDLPSLARACTVSVASATLASALVALGGIPLGYLLARVPGRASAALGFLVQLPLALPPLASGVLLLFLLGRRSVLGRLSGGSLTDSFVGVVLAEAFVAAPFLIIAARSAFASIDPAIEAVAATLGHKPLSVFFRVSLPLAWPATRSGLLLSWLRAFGEFGATIMVAYHPYSLPVYTYVAFGSHGLPSMLPVLVPTLAISLSIMLLSGAGRRSIAPGSAIAAKPADTEDPLPPPATTAASESRVPPPLRLLLHKQLGEFRLSVAWQSRARRLAILGPSGSGKSLTLRLIAGVENLDAGSIMLGDRELGPLRPPDRGVAYVPQNYCLFPHLNVADHIRFPIGARPEIARHWLPLLGLQAFLQRFPASLSLGQQQRVALLRALVRPADLLLLDEPFSALDAPLRAQLRRALRALQREIDMTTILVTHDPSEAALLADELLVLAGGQVLQCGDVASVFLRPANQSVARLLGAEDINSGCALSEDRLDIGGGLSLRTAGPALPPGQDLGWSVRQDRIQLHPHGEYEAIIEASTRVGAEWELRLRLGAATLHALRTQPPLALSTRCRLDIPPTAIQVWPAPTPHAAGSANHRPA
jgi:molybdate transport system permease protein